MRTSKPRWGTTAAAILPGVKRLRGLLAGGIRRDALWLFGSQLVALIVTFVATPIQLERMGNERYGIVVVLSAAVGFLSLSDLGAAWAVMRFVPWHRARGDDVSAQRVIVAAMLVSLTIGLGLGAVVFALAAPLSSLLNVSPSLANQTTHAARITAAFIPVMLLASVFSGLGRAVGMFPLVGVVAAGNVILLNVVWVAVAGEPDDIVKVMAAQVLIGCAAIIVSATVIGVRRPWAARPRLPHRDTLLEVTSFGAKTSAGQMGLGLLTTADKPVLASILPVSLLPFYSIPFALALRIALVSSSVSSAIFPPVVAALANGDEPEFARLRQRAFAVVGLVSGLLAVNCVFGGRPLLTWWLGADFADDAWLSLAILGVGFGVFACGSIGNVLLDAGGRPGVAAALMVAGGVTGLMLCGLLAALWGSPAAGSLGTSIGLVIVGIGGIELARRLVVPVDRLRSFVGVFAAWMPLAVSGLILRAASELADIPAIVAVVVIAAGTAAVGLVAYRRIEPSRI